MEEFEEEEGLGGWRRDLGGFFWACGFRIVRLVLFNHVGVL